jgi:GTP cyclohydrolase FolE2
MNLPRRREPRLSASHGQPGTPLAAAGDRVTVTLVPKAAADLQSAHERTSMSKTDIVNRAISLYEFVEAEMSSGAEIIVRRDGEDYVVEML